MNTHRLPPRVERILAASVVSLGLASGLAHGDGPTSNPTVWVANGRDATVSVIDRVDGDTLARLPSGGNPHVLDLSPDGSTMYVVNAGGHDLPNDDGAAHAARSDASPLATNSLWALDTSSGDVVGRVAVGTGPTHPVASPDGTRVYVTNTDDDSVSIVDTGSWTVVETVTGVPEPHDAAISADGTRLLIAAAGGNEVLVLDTETLAVVDRFAVGNKVRGLIVDHEDAVAYATNKADGTVSRIDLNSGDIQTFAVGAGPHGLRLAPDGSRLYIALSGANAVAYVDPASGAVERTVPVGASPEQLDVSPDGAWLAVANAADESVTLVNVERAASVRSSATGPGTFGVAFSNAPLDTEAP